MGIFIQGVKVGWEIGGGDLGSGIGEYGVVEALYPRRPYSQHLIFFVTYEWAQWAKVFVPGKPFRPSVMLHSSLLGTLVSYIENYVLRFVNTAPDDSTRSYFNFANVNIKSFG